MPRAIMTNNLDFLIIALCSNLLWATVGLRWHHLCPIQFLLEV